MCGEPECIVDLGAVVAARGSDAIDAETQQHLDEPIDVRHAGTFVRRRLLGRPMNHHCATVRWKRERGY